jgi:hypothetical protein
MAKRKSGVNKSEEIRQLLQANPKVGAKEVKDTLGANVLPQSKPEFAFVRVRGNTLAEEHS